MGGVEEITGIEIIDVMMGDGVRDQEIEKKNGGIEADRETETVGDTEMAREVVTGIGGIGSVRPVGRGIGHGEVGKYGLFHCMRWE